jgi:hypothetical protein
MSVSGTSKTPQRTKTTSSADGVIVIAVLKFQRLLKFVLNNDYEVPPGFDDLNKE